MPSASSTERHAPVWEVWVSPIDDPEAPIRNRIQARDLEHLEQIVEGISPCMRIVAAIKEEEHTTC